MVIPLLGVKTRCADKSTAEHYIHTYIWLEITCYLNTGPIQIVPSAADLKPKVDFKNRSALAVCFLFSCYSHQSISDYSWEVYIVHSGVFAG